MQALEDLGQSVWLDYFSRGMVRSGKLEGLIRDGLRGMTSNPTIFERAIGGSADYDETLRDPAVSRKTDRELFEALAIEDVREAADQFRPVYDRTGGADGFVSLEVSPAVARDTESSIAEARRLWRVVGRPNLMIKIPGMREGWPAIERCLREGININITLLFSVEHYRAVSEAYLRALEARVRDGQPVDRLASVASFFVSRVDTEVDRRIDAQAARSWRCAAGWRSPMPGWHMPPSLRRHKVRAGVRWHRRGPGYSARSGLAPAPRTRRTPTCSTWKH
jgi:transaldolase